MPDFKWPEEKGQIGSRTTRLDGPIKSTGRATYSFDVNRPGMLYAKILHCPHAHARIQRIDTAAAERIPGVRAVRVIQEPGTEIQWALDEIAYVAADTEEAARDAVGAIEVQYDVLPHYVNEIRKDAAPVVNPGEESVVGDPESSLQLRGPLE